MDGKNVLNYSDESRLKELFYEEQRKLIEWNLGFSKNGCCIDEK